MKLADIKKLKVSELRTRLQLKGLDSKGLKAELVGRLWSALESGLTDECLEQDASEVQNNDEDVLVSTAQLSASTTATAPSGLERSREYSDTGTQTDAVEYPSPTPNSGSLPGSECPTAGGELVRPQGACDHHKEGRGRAFYEFKEEIRYKRTKLVQDPLRKEVEIWSDRDKVQLNSHDAHLHFEVGPDGSSGWPRFWDRFPLLWSGCRLSHGVAQGWVGFEVRVERKLSIAQMGAPERSESCGMRVGWSVADSCLLLGEEEFSFAYDATGEKVSGGKSEEFGEQYSEGDIIGCYVSFSDVIQFSFHKNGHFMGNAFSVDSSRLLGHALFPHVLCKNCYVKFNLDPNGPPWYPTPQGFTSLVTLPAEQRVTAASATNDSAVCEMVLLVGLPGSGKSRWARSHMQEHPEKHFQLLGTEELLSCMMNAEQRELQLQQAAQCLTELIKVAASTPGNYILDQCNTLFSARCYKLQLFKGFRRRVVVIFPSTEQWRKRLAEQQRQDGEQIPHTDLLKLQVSCSLPEQQDDLMDELQYIELSQEAAQSLLQECKDEAHRLLPPVPIQVKKKPKIRKRPHPYGCSYSGWTQWNQGWSEAKSNQQPWSQPPGYWSLPYPGQSINYNNWSFGR
ncbi:heterogeneous nuclear ribonucleoprotein U-like protein 2 isoform X1 [Synchiropus splendidus]|uniref:heterogeneous nuclear ribonucleoprotein U-like protein 2 isoform X1 n=1 Tax=Synchiropus splendidus TaxID=270530 RepID=UPI00237E746A|nr:heterogeneous nuclear ribonucleoprotein U-like protein 2 isoform X1 [Synchiropus splendidus]